MVRARATKATHRRHKKVLRRASGFVGGRHRLFRTAQEAVIRAEAFATKARKKKKGDFRRLWITRITAALRGTGINYSRFINGLKNAAIALNRKMLSQLAIEDPQAFTKLIDTAKASIK